MEEGNSQKRNGIKEGIRIFSARGERGETQRRRSIAVLPQQIPLPPSVMLHFARAPECVKATRRGKGCSCRNYDADFHGATEANDIFIANLKLAMIARARNVTT